MTTVAARLSYANVTASLALFVALGGTGYAAITLPRNSIGAKQLRSNAVRSSEIRDNAIKTHDINRRARTALRGQQGPPGPAAVTEQARVASNGGLAGGTAIASSWNINDQGRYRIQFQRDITDCAYSATLASVPGGNVTEPAAGRVTVAHDVGPAVIVKTYDAAGNPAQQPFHLIVAC